MRLPAPRHFSERASFIRLCSCKDEDRAPCLPKSEDCEQAVKTIVTYTILHGNVNNNALFVFLFGSIHKKQSRFLGKIFL